MNNKLFNNYWLLASAFLIQSLLGACTSVVEDASPTPQTLVTPTASAVETPTPSLHKLGDAIEGKYTVSYYIFQGEGLPREWVEIGELLLNNGEYIFTPAEGITIPDEAKERMYFVREPRGNYSIEYLQSFDQNTILENLDFLEILLSIYFGEEINIGGFGVGFLIRNNNEGKGLFFHSHVSELELWDVNKSWDE